MLHFGSGFLLFNGEGNSKYFCTSGLKQTMATGLHNRVFDFLTTLNGAGSADDAWKKTALFMGNLGAGCVGINIDPDGYDPAGMWTTPQWVQDMYWAEVYPGHDPKREYCRNNVTPYFYGKEFWHHEPDLPEPRRRLDEEMSSAGVRSVVAIPVHNFSDSEWGFFGFSGDLDAAEFGRLYEDRGTAFHLAGIGAYIRMRALMKEEQAAAIGISERERECLLWLSRGLRNDQIADRLGLRPVTVEFHIAKARRRLNARTREQALVRAIQLNILEP